MKMIRIKSFDMSYNTGVWDIDAIEGFGLVDLDLIGWLVEDRKDCIIIASEYQPNEEQVRHLIAIPKVCIKETQILQEK